MGFDYGALSNKRLGIPGGWCVVAVGDVSSINELSIESGYPHGTIDYIDIASVEKGGIHSIQILALRDAPSRAKRIVRDKDILISTVRPNLEHYAFVRRAKPNTIASTGFTTVTAENVDPRYLYYYLTTKPFTAYLSQIAASHTSAYPAINPDVIETAELLLPPSDEQRAIAHILGTLDDKIELNRRMNETLEAMAQALFKSWFVDFEPFCDQSMQDSPLGEIPVGWTIGELADLAAVTSGKRPDRRSHVSAGQMRIPLYGGNGPMGCVEKPLYSVPLLLTGRVGTLGMVFRVTFPCWPSDNTLVALAYGSESYEYLCFRMRAIDYNALNRGSTQALVTQTDLQRHGLIIPPNAILCEFHNLISPLFGLVDHNGAENNTLAGIRDALLPKLLSGEIRVKDAETLLEDSI